MVESVAALALGQGTDGFLGTPGAIPGTLAQPR